MEQYLKLLSEFKNALSNQSVTDEYLTYVNNEVYENYSFYNGSDEILFWTSKLSREIELHGEFKEIYTPYLIRLIDWILSELAEVGDIDV